MTRWLSVEEQRAWRAWLAAVRTVTSALDAQLQRDSDMPHAYYEVLVRLSEQPDRSLRMSDLAEATQSSRSRLSHAVSRLEERGWVERRPCEQDARGLLAVLTPLGFEALAAAAPGHVEAVRAALLDPLRPEQVAQLEEICSAVVAHGAAGREAPGDPDPAG